MARHESQDSGVAEVVVAVDPQWWRVGSTTALVELPAEAALDRGVHTFTTTYLAENWPVASLVRDADGGLTTDREVEIHRSGSLSARRKPGP